LNNRLLRALLADATAWEWATFEEQALPERIARLYPDVQFA
jgi:UDP-3-O-acyl-N-acetylglucosamine deacetylase